MAVIHANPGGGVARRRFTHGGRIFVAGETLSADAIRAIPPRNLRAMLDANMLETWPAAAGERYVVHAGRGQFDVIEGRKLNDQPLSKEDAEELAMRD